IINNLIQEEFYKYLYKHKVQILFFNWFEYYAFKNRQIQTIEQSRFNSSSVYDWNIDGISEYNILYFLQKMTMAANAYRTQVGNEDRTVAELLIAGFSGQLKGWWDNYLNNQQRSEILDAVKTDEDNVPILDNFGNLQQDAVATLVIAITLHFIGDPSVLRDKNAELLSNLKCKRLRDCSNSYYSKNKPRKYSKTYRNHKSHENSWQKPRKRFTPKEITNSKPFYKNLTCFKCNKKGHTSKFRRFNRKIQELGLGEELSSKISNLLLDHSSSSSNDSDSSLSSEKALQVDELKNSSSGSESDENKRNVLTKDQELQIEILNSISNLQTKQNFLETILSSLNEKEIKISENTSKPHNPTSSKSSYDLTTILNKRKKDSSKTTIQDLRMEIKEVKNDLKTLREKQKRDSEYFHSIISSIKGNHDSSSDEQDNDNLDNIEDDISLKEQIQSLDSAPKDFLCVLREITSRKYKIKITLVFSENYKIDTIALFDTGTDLNCIKSGLVTKCFHLETREKLSAANNSKLRITSKAEASIFKDNIFIKTAFVLTDDIYQNVILGTPFINLITPYKVMDDSISFKTQNKKLNYSTIKKEILSIVLCIQKFQSDLLNNFFLLRIDCKSVKDVLQKDVKHLASKHIFARWQAILSIFDFDIKYIKGDSNSVPDFLTRELLQNSNDPFSTIEKYFGKNRFFKPHNTDKTVLFFQTILEITGSVSFKHFYLNENHSDPAYSTFKIHKVIAPSDWEYDLNENLNFPENLKDLSCFNVSFNYWDYCQAWYNSFLIQSPKRKHTWLIFFDTTCDLSKSPYCFIPWWNYFDSVTEIFKPNIQKSFQIFKTNFIPSEDEKNPH
ncbi:hypothetical protein EUTSA_v10024111mg, partial [Eutrema salsugineum]